MIERRQPAVLCAVFFASGASALLFETLWFRLCGLAFGNSVWASSMVLTSFMAGLALGNALVTAKTARSVEPLRLYAALEIAVAAGGLAIVLALPALTHALAPALRPFVDSPLLLNSVRLTFAGLLMVVPTTAMGATLPLLVKASSREGAPFGARLGLLYGWNTAGAVAGAIAGELVLIEALGLRGTGVIAALLNLGAAATAIVLSRAPRVIPTLSEAEGEGPGGAGLRATRPQGPSLSASLGVGMTGPLLAAAFLAGATLLALEVVWFRFLLLFTDGTSLAFAVMLAAVLFGIAAGGLIASRLIAIDGEAERWTATVALGCAVVTALSFAGFAPGRAPALAATAIVLRDAAAALRLMLLTSVGSGILFTLIGKSLQKRVGDDIRSAALLTLANTIGAMLGAFAAGFILLPRMGAERSILALVCCYGLIAVLTFAAERRVPAPALGIAAIAFALCLIFFPFGIISGTFLPSITKTYRDAGEHILLVREGLSETDIVLRHDLWGQPYEYRLMTNGISMSGTSLLSRRYMSLFVDLPMALNPAASQALLICYGVGSTAKALTDTRSLRSIDIVDISRDVLEMSHLRRFDGGHPLDDPRVRVHIEDGRFFLLTTPQRFDLITAEPPPPKNAGVVNLYSREYFELIHDRLKEGGVASYWLPVEQLRGSEGKAIIKAFCLAFDDCSLWSGGGPELILLGSHGLRPVTAAGFAQRWRDPRTSRSLEAIGLSSPEMMGTLFIADAPWLRQCTTGAPPLTDDFPLRLSPRPVPELAAEFEPLFDVHAAQRRFAESRWIAAIWPPELKQKTIESFIVRDLTDRYFFSRLGPRPATMYGAVGYLLSHTSDRILPAILLGSDTLQRDIAATLRSRGVVSPEIGWVEGVWALSNRRYGAAAALLSQASRERPGNPAWARDAAFAAEAMRRLQVAAASAPAR